jgi:hypothetical protein
MIDNLRLVQRLTKYLIVAGQQRELVIDVEFIIDEKLFTVALWMKLLIVSSQSVIIRWMGFKGINDGFITE